MTEASRANEAKGACTMTKIADYMGNDEDIEEVISKIMLMEEQDEERAKARR